MSDERLAELYQRAASSGLDYDDAADLLEEVERLRDERKFDDERTEYAVNLIIALADASPCRRDKGGCVMHNEYVPEGSDCPHALAQAFLAGTGAWSKS